MREADENQLSGSALVVVPNAALARALGRVAEGLGLVPVIALAADALDVALREKPRIVLLDLDDPEPALTLCRGLRAEPVTAQLPIVGVTSSPQLPRGARAAGVTDFVTKPVDRETLATRIAFHLDSTDGSSAGGEVDRRLLRLETAQALAGIGYWEWDVETDEVRLGPGTAAVLRLRDPLPTQLSELLVACVHSGDHPRFSAGLRDALAGEPSADGLLSRHPATDSEYYLKHFVSVSRSQIGAPLVTITVRDVTNERRAEQSARRMAFYDGLTGLPNRRLFEKRLAGAMRRFGAQPEAVGLLFIDLDGFKGVNDRMGHAAGDELLRAVGQRLLESVRGGDEVSRVAPPQGSVSRFGGDEFAVLLTGLRQTEDAAECARRIRRKLAAAFEIEGGEVRIGGSIGIAIHPRDGATTAALLHAADAAMYAAKSDRTAEFCFYRADLDAVGSRHRLMVEQLSGAAERGELSIVLQPKFDLATGHISGAEALARWNNPLLGAVHPADFIPVAEESDLILKIGGWVLEAACQEATGWNQKMIDPPSVAVNVSRVQLVSGDLERVVYDALMRSKLDPKRLELEITESLMIEGENAIAPLRDLCAIGLTLALDDFGSGYSTLASLVRFPVNTVKLDRALVRDIDSNPDAARVVRAVIRMAHEMGRRVVAEGVDNPAALRLLREAECDEAQGFLLAKPMSCQEFRALLASWRPIDALASWR